jgi:hypothetical protein
MKLNLKTTWEKDVVLTEESLKSVHLEGNQTITAVFFVSTPDLIDKLQTFENDKELSTKQRLGSVTRCILSDLVIKTDGISEQLEVVDPTTTKTVGGVQTVEFLPIGLINDIVTGFF